MTGTAVRQQHVTSADSTRICVTITGDGPPLVVCPGALAVAGDWQSVADALAPRMTTYAVDRRGHGASGDGPVFSIEREQEDLAAVLELAGPGAVLLGHSYGALISLGLALRRPPARLVVYEPPIPVDGPAGGAAIEDYAAAIREGDPEKALMLGLREFVGLPEDAIAAFRKQPIWPRLAVTAPSLTRELRAVDRFGGDLARFRAIRIPVLLIVGAVSSPRLRDISFRLAAVIPGAAVAEIPGQAHDAHLFGAEAIAEKIAQFALSGVPGGGRKVESRSAGPGRGSELPRRSACAEPPMTARAAATEDGLRARVSALSLEQKVRLLTGADFWSARAEPAAGLRRLVFSDGPAGVRGETWDERYPSANVPSPTALAATWDEDRAERLGRLLAAEARRKGVDVLLAPTVNLHRTPYGGRHFECFSEDPLLTGRIGAACVRGLQSAGVGATVKHFVANDSETARFTVDVRVSERALRELYLAPFEMIVREAGVWAVMAAYNGVNGHTMTEHPLLREVLKGEWGFDGLVVSDWYACRSLAAAADGLLDLAMPGPAGPWGAALAAAVSAGHVSEEAVDGKVLRLLRLAGRVGALRDVPTARAPTLGAEQISAELRDTASAGFVLARNEPAEPGAARLLPLSAGQLRRVAVLGPSSTAARTLGGGSATVFPPYAVSPLDGLRAALGPAVRVDHARGGRSSHRVPAAGPELLGGRAGSDPAIEVRFLDADGALLGSEERHAAAFTWMGSAGDGIPVERIAAVEASTRVRADRDGTYLIGAAGVGTFRLTIGGAVRLDTRLTLPDSADPGERLMRPPQRVVPVPLSAGGEVDLVLRHEPLPAGGFGHAAVSLISFQLLAAADTDDQAELAEAVALASEADVAVVVVGTTEDVESEGFDRASLALPGRQDELVRRICQANPRTVVVVNAGAPVLLPWAEDVPAVLLAWFPGQEFGNALADVLLGVAEPGGRLPVSWPAAEQGLPSTTPAGGKLGYDEDLFIGYRWYDRSGQKPLYRFGHGLGYTTWEYLSAELSPGAGEAAAVVVTMRMRNTGARGGREVVHVYAGRPDSAIERPARWLAGFATVTAGPGEEVTTWVAVPRRAFEHWDVAGQRWAVEPGTFVLSAEMSSDSATLDVPTSMLSG